MVLAGHRRLLAAVQRTLQAGRRVLLCPTAGRAGTGATTAMVEFAHRNARDYDIAWWIRAADPELVPDELAALAETLGVAGTDDDAETAAARALQALRHRDRYLIVFDDGCQPAPADPVPAHRARSCRDHLVEPGLALVRDRAHGGAVHPRRVRRLAAPPEPELCETGQP